MGLLDSILGSLGDGGSPQQQPQGQAASLSPLVMALIQMVMSRPGGLGGLLQSFQQNGLGHLADSWVGTGANLPVSEAQVHQALGSDAISQIAQAAGIPIGDAAGQIARALPHVVDHATPDGRLPEGGEDPFASLLKGLGG